MQSLWEPACWRFECAALARDFAVSGATHDTHPRNQRQLAQQIENRCPSLSTRNSPRDTKRRVVTPANAHHSQQHPADVIVLTPMRASNQSRQHEQHARPQIVTNCPTVRLNTPMNSAQISNNRRMSPGKLGPSDPSLPVSSPDAGSSRGGAPRLPAPIEGCCAAPCGRRIWKTVRESPPSTADREKTEKRATHVQSP